MENTTPLAPVRLSSSISHPPTIRRTQSSKIQNLVEYTHIPDSAQINETSVPLLNPYNIFKRSKSLSQTSHPSCPTQISSSQRIHPVNSP
jgi:hypothetical protein